MIIWANVDPVLSYHIASPCPKVLKTCFLFGAQPLTEPVITCVSWNIRNEIQRNMNPNTFFIFIQDNIFEYKASKQSVSLSTPNMSLAKMVCNKYVIITSKRRFDVIIRYILRSLFAGSILVVLNFSSQIIKILPQGKDLFTLLVQYAMVIVVKQTIYRCISVINVMGYTIGCRVGVKYLRKQWNQIKDLSLQIQDQLWVLKVLGRHWLFSPSTSTKTSTWVTNIDIVGLQPKTFCVLNFIQNSLKS